jgi:signal transduction histidine kinase
VTTTATVSEHATSLMHDFRNPLAAIHAAAELLIRVQLSETQTRRIAENLYGASLGPLPTRSRRRQSRTTSSSLRIFRLGSRSPWTGAASAGSS